MEKYITIPNPIAEKPDVFIRVSKIFSVKKYNNANIYIEYVDKARDKQIEHDSDQGFQMAEWLIANVLRANRSKSTTTRATKPPFDISGFYEM